MDSTARAARSDDTTGLKMDGLHYIVATLTDVNAEQSLTLLQLANKSSRGFQNVLVGRLLCPHRHSVAYAEDPAGYVLPYQSLKHVLVLIPTLPYIRTCIKLQAGSLSCTAENMPAFLYPNDQPYNSADRLRGLLRGPLCVMVYKRIFTGPASAMGIVGTTRRKTQAQLIGLERTTPRTIAYAVVQVSMARECHTSNSLTHALGSTYVEFPGRLVLGGRRLQQPPLLQ